MTMYQISRADICMSDPMPFNQHWEARIACPIERIEDMGYSLQQAHSAMRVGDLVNVTAFARKDWERMTEVASFRIVSRTAQRLLAIQVSETVKVPADLEAKVAPAMVQLEVVQIGKSFEVKDSRGNVIETFVERLQADEFVAREMNNGRSKIPATALDKTKWSIKRGLAGRHQVINENGEPIREFPNKIEAEAFIAA